MPGRLGPRFALETLFLIALAAGAAFADLDIRWIAAIMAAGWVVVALLEWTSERLWATLPPWRRPYYSVPAPLAAPPPAPVVEAEPDLEPEPETIIVSRVEPVAEPELEPEPESEPEPVDAWPERAPDPKEPEP